MIDVKEEMALQAMLKMQSLVSSYLVDDIDKSEPLQSLLDFIDALDEVEYERNKRAFLDILLGDASIRKNGIMALEKEHDFTDRERQVLRYLANDRKPDYIAEKLGIALATAKVHKYSIYNKLGVHSNKEFSDLLTSFDNLSKQQRSLDNLS